MFQNRFYRCHAATALLSASRRIGGPRHNVRREHSGRSRPARFCSAIGLYGLLAFNVAERRREIAVRLALAAEPTTIVRMVVGQGRKLVSIGLVVGGVASYTLGLSRLVSRITVRCLRGVDGLRSRQQFEVSQRGMWELVTCLYSS